VNRNGGRNMSLGVSGGTDLMGNLLFNRVAHLVGDCVADLSCYGVAFLPGYRVADFSGNRVTFLSGNWVADFSGNRVAFLSGNWVADFSGDRNTLLFLTGNLDLDWVAGGDWLGNTYGLGDGLG
jgi:hypothetical protein